MTQKVLKVGSSAAVTISSQALKELGIVIGDNVEATVDKKTCSFVVRKISKKTAVSNELHEWTNKFIKAYRPALDALAKK